MMKLSKSNSLRVITGLVLICQTGGGLLATEEKGTDQAATPTASEWVSAGGTARDEDNEKELYSTPARSPKPALQLPCVVNRLPAVTIRNEKMAASVPEALLDTPGVMVQQTAHGQGSPYLRGFTGFRTLMLVDGIRLNNSTFRDGPNQYWSTVDALAIERLEVVQGPSSVLYGSDAIGGTVNALMRGPGYGFGGGTKWGGTTYYRFGSADRTHLGRTEFSGAERDRWGFSLGLTGKTFGDVEGGNEVGRQPHTGFDQYDADMKADYYFSASTRLTVAWQRTQQLDVERTHRTVYGTRWNGLTTGTDLQHQFDQLRQLAYGRLVQDTARVDRFTGTVSWQQQDELQYVQRANRMMQRNGVDVGTLGLSFQGESPSPFGDWVYGVEHYHDIVGSYQRNYNAAGVFTSSAIQGPVADDSSYDLLGVYAQDDLELAERLHGIVGGRLTWAGADAGIVRDPVTGRRTTYERDWLNLCGSGRLVWHPDAEKHWSLYTGAAQGFRAPNLSDLSRFDIARSGEIETAAPDLSPEHFVSIEAGVKAMQKNWDAGLACYRTFIEDMIVRAPTGAIVSGNREVTKLNASGGWVHGIEGNARGYLGEGFSLFGSVAWQEGQADAFPTSTTASLKAPLSRTPPLTGMAGVRWDAVLKGYFAEVYTVMSDQQDRLSPDDLRDTQRIPPGGTPGWITLNLRTGYDWKGRFRAVAAMENMLDEDYRVHGSGYNQPGRNFKLSLEYKF